VAARASQAKGDTWTDDADWVVLRPWAAEAIGKLTSDIPAAMQARTQGHPHCPFFHRIKVCVMLFAALCMRNSYSQPFSHPPNRTLSKALRTSTLMMMTSLPWTHRHSHCLLHLEKHRLHPQQQQVLCQ